MNTNYQFNTHSERLTVHSSTASSARGLEISTLDFESGSSKYIALLVYGQLQLSYLQVLYYYLVEISLSSICIELFGHDDNHSRERNMAKPRNPGLHKRPCSIDIDVLWSTNTVRTACMHRYVI